MLYVSLKSVMIFVQQNTEWGFDLNQVQTCCQSCWVCSIVHCLSMLLQRHLWQHWECNVHSSLCWFVFACITVTWWRVLFTSMCMTLCMFSICSHTSLICAQLHISKLKDSINARKSTSSHAWIYKTYVKHTQTQTQAKKQHMHSGNRLESSH